MKVRLVNLCLYYKTQPNMKKTSKMQDRQGTHYQYRGLRGSGLICNQKVSELGLSQGDQFMALADETMNEGGEHVIKTSKGLIPIRYFIEK